MANFSFKFTTMTYTESKGVISAALNLEGSADGFGTVMGTLTAHGAGTGAGTYDFVLVSYPETGDQVTATGTGDWTKADGDHWKGTGSSTLSTGDVFKHDSVFQLSTRTWSGTFG